jgi:hypothetical protein
METSIPRLGSKLLLTLVSYLKKLFLLSFFRIQLLSFKYAHISLFILLFEDLQSQMVDPTPSSYFRRLVKSLSSILSCRKILVPCLSISVIILQTSLLFDLIQGLILTKPCLLLLLNLLVAVDPVINVLNHRVSLHIAKIIKLFLSHQHRGVLFEHDGIGVTQLVDRLFLF